MSKVTFTAVTHNNNDFQQTISRLLNNLGANANNSLIVLQTLEGEIVIQPMKSPKVAQHSNLNTDVANRKTVIVHDVYEENPKFLSLTPDQIRLMEWLKDEGFALCEWDWQVVENIEIKTI